MPRRENLPLRAYVSHLATCEAFFCATCGLTLDSDLHYVGTPDSHAFAARPCSCGVEALVAEWERDHQ